jgi:hypothetical protein
MVQVTRLAGARGHFFLDHVHAVILHEVPAVAAAAPAIMFGVTGVNPAVSAWKRIGTFVRISDLIVVPRPCYWMGIGLGATMGSTFRALRRRGWRISGQNSRTTLAPVSTPIVIPAEANPLDTV